MPTDPFTVLAEQNFRDRLLAVEQAWNADVVTILAGILPGLEHSVRDALAFAPTETRRPRLLVILQTGGGAVEVVERIVTHIRALYSEIWIAVPDKAMSAGTVFAMAADEIFMDAAFSVLGPIDPQVERKIDGESKLVPCLAYIQQYDLFIAKSALGKLTSAEFALLSKMDLAELQQFKDQRELSVDLLKEWLTKYKFKNWTTTETRNAPVTQQMKETRAEEIARKLNDPQRWHSHARGISVPVLTSAGPEGLNLKIRDFASEPPQLAQSLARYYVPFVTFLEQRNVRHFIHSRIYF